MNHLNMVRIQHLKEKLLREKKELEDWLDSGERFGLADSQREQSGELSMVDNHPGDTATEIYERAKDIALLERREHRLEQVMLALASMETGTYGLCAVCGSEIPYERLDAVPSTPYCIEHAEQEVSERRPIEEEFMQPPFGRTSLDGADQTGFDGEDVWQIVASWGNSNSPALAEDRQIEDYDDVVLEEDEQEGYVEPIESFLATDLYGDKVSVVRNKAYYRYLADKEGDRELEVLPLEETDESAQPQSSR